jgi:hypothetical protein
MHKALTVDKNGLIVFHRHHGPRLLPRDYVGLKDFLIEELGYKEQEEVVTEKTETWREEGMLRTNAKPRDYLVRITNSTLTKVRSDGVVYTIKLSKLYSEEYGSPYVDFRPLKVTRSDLPEGASMWKRRQWSCGWHTVCHETTGWKGTGWANTSCLLQLLYVLPLHEDDLKPDPIELKFELGEGLVLTSGTLSSEWAKAYIRHYLEDASALLEQVMARIDEDKIEVQRLFDIV